MAVDVVAIITLFGSDVGDRGNKNTNGIPKKIVFISLANCFNNCSKQDTKDNNDIPSVDVPTINSELENDNIDENVVTNDDDDEGNDDANNNAGNMPGDNKDDDSNGEDSVSDNNNTNFTTKSTNTDTPWTSFVAVTDDNVNNDPNHYDEFWLDYDFDDDGVFNNDDADIGEGYVCMMVTDSWLPPKDECDDDNILLHLGVFNGSDKPSIHSYFFNGTLNDSLGPPCINDNPISSTQVFHHTLLKSSMRKKEWHRQFNWALQRT